MPSLAVTFLGTVLDRSETALLCGLADRGLRIRAHLEPRSRAIGELERRGISVVPWTLDRSQATREAEHLGHCLREHPPDVVHVLRSKALRRLHASGLTDWPPTAFYRGTLQQPQWWRPADRRKYFDPRIRKFVAVSEAVREALISGGVRPDRVTVIRKGHDPAWYDVSAVDVRGEFGIARTSTLVGVIANIRREKGVEFAVQAARILESRNRDVHLLIVGQDERPMWQRRWRPLQRNGIVTCTGMRRDVAAILPSLDILLIPSLREGSPRVAAEAMLRGIPVVASAVGGIPEIVADGKTGLLVPPANPEAIAAAVQRLLADPLLRSSFGEAGRRFFLEHVTVERAVERTLRMYDELQGSID